MVNVYKKMRYFHFLTFFNISQGLTQVGVYLPTPCSEPSTLNQLATLFLVAIEVISNKVFESLY